MQPENSQIDVLLKRFGREARSGAPAEHLDADELNAFAEGAAPAAARSRYVSHLSECNDCRTLATQLTIAAGATVNAGAGAIETASGAFWQKLTSFFTPPMLRYAAFAAVLLVAVGVTFLALRNQRESRLDARNEQTNEAQAGAVKQDGPAAPAANQTARTFASPSATVSQTTGNPNVDSKKDESKAADATGPPPKPEKEGATTTDQPLFVRGAEPVIAKQQETRQQPQASFAPPPPGEAGRLQTQSREDRDAQRVASVSGQRKSEPSSDKLKEMDKSVGGISQTRAAEGDDNRARNYQMNQQSTNQQNQQSQNRILDSNAEAPRAGNLSVNRARDEENTETAKKPATSGARRESEKAPETRSAGGHKFRRQGNAWVDSKLKSSMPITNVGRGSDAFRALDPAVRSMAEQLGGEVIVVSKGKAYRIR
ncbi:MAG TPA: hypothetical protein VLQ90_12845 [Pyrinomonadaceae bacterium]|nr:hypothetical protein [Pyrinomonadaceae bacterium]